MRRLFSRGDQFMSESRRVEFVLLPTAASTSMRSVPDAGLLKHLLRPRLQKCWFAMKNQNRLTQGYPDDLAAMIAATYHGQAHWARGGPFAATCGECRYYNYWRPVCDKNNNTTSTVCYRGCKKYFELVGRHGATFPSSAAACKYFERRQLEQTS